MTDFSPAMLDARRRALVYAAVVVDALDKGHPLDVQDVAVQQLRAAVHERDALELGGDR